MALDVPSNGVITADEVLILIHFTALYQLNKQHQVLPSNSATLTVCRQRLDLPAFPEHNALDDALATMQLFYAQLNELGITLENSLESLAHTNAVGRFRLGVLH